MVPVLPTTPLVLAAAACFGKASPRFEGWLLRNPVFGPYIENHRNHVGVSKLHKYGAIGFLWAGLGVSAILVDTWWVLLILAVVGIAVTIHLAMLKVRVKGSPPGTPEPPAKPPGAERPARN